MRQNWDVSSYTSDSESSVPPSGHSCLFALDQKFWNLKGKEILNQAPSLFNDKLFPFHCLFLFNSHTHKCSRCQSSLHADLGTRCPRGPQAVGVGYGERQTGTMSTQGKLWLWRGDRMPGNRCQHQPPRGPTAQVHPHLSWLKLLLLLPPDTQDPHIPSTPVLRERPNHSWCVTFAKTPTSSKPQCFDLGNGKSGQCGFHSPFQFLYLGVSQTSLKAKHPGSIPENSRWGPGSGWSWGLCIL